MVRTLEIALIASVALMTSSTPALSQPANAAKIEAGRRLFKSLDCASCHSVNEVGGCMGPDLAGVTSRRTQKYLTLRLSKDTEDEFISLIKHPEIFPHPRFSSREVQSIIAYLGTLKATKAKTIPGHKVTSVPEDKPAGVLKTASDASLAEGRRLFLDSGCMSCHSIGNTGGNLAPRLDGIGTRRSRAYVDAHISDPHKHLRKTQPGTTSKMVQSDLAPADIQKITDYLLSLPPIK